jgi:glycerol uptake facilitator-like aquaporin
MRAKIIGEAFGTFFLCFALLLGGGPLPLAALLAALTYLAAPAGFPHFNPAVTLAFRLRGRIASRAAWAFVGAQLLAAAAALLLAACLRGTIRRGRRKRSPDFMTTPSRASRPAS